jgi:hypothetical protein
MQSSRAAIPAKNFKVIFLHYEVKSKIVTRAKTLVLHIIEDRTCHSFCPTSECSKLTDRGNMNKTIPRA